MLRKIIPRFVLCLVLILQLLAGCTVRFPVTVYKPPAYEQAQAADSGPAADPAVRAYLEKHHTEVVAEADGSYKSGLEPIDMSKYDLLLAGEAHATKKNFDIELALIEYLYKTSGVRFLLLEDGYASAGFLNRYLQTGDNGLLVTYMTNLAGTAGGSREAYEFWQKVCQFNASLPQNARLTAVGIDIEHQLTTSYIYIQLLVKDKQIPQEIEIPMKSLSAYPPDLNKNGIAVQMKTLRADMDKNRPLYQQCLGDDFYSFELSVSNCLVGIEAYSDDMKNFDAIREPALYKNFLSVYEHYGKPKFFGQFGSEHIFQTDCSTGYYKTGSDRFAISLQKDGSPLRGRVCSVLYTYKTCSAMNKNGFFDIREEALIQTGALSSLSGSNVTLFDFRSEDSPFAKASIFMKSPTTNATLDYFQYLVLISHSDPCTRYKPS